jgi:hypothetical protein
MELLKKGSCNSILYLKKVRELKEIEVSRIRGELPKNELNSEIVQ